MKKTPKPLFSKNNLSKYAYYSGSGFQMLAIIGIFTFAGSKLDEVQQTEKPIYTAILAVIGVCISIYSIIKSLSNRKRRP